MEEKPLNKSRKLSRVAFKSARPKSSLGHRGRANSIFVTDLSNSHRHKSPIPSPPKPSRQPGSSTNHLLYGNPVALRPYLSAPWQCIKGVTVQQLTEIYEARCKDLNISTNTDQHQRFLTFCAKHIRNGKIQLNDLGLSLASASSIASVLLNNEVFHSVCLSKNSLADKGTILVAKAIKNNNSLVHLDLSSNDITPEGFTKVLELLIPHRTLCSLDISSHEGLHRNRLRALGAYGVMKLIALNSTLSILDVSGCSIGAEGFEYILEGFRRNLGLVSLNLSNSELGSCKVERMFELLLKSKLESLSLAGNELNKDTAKALGSVLSNGKCPLKRLDLSKNNLGTKGAVKIFEALCSSDVLEQLNLENNPMHYGPSVLFLNFLTSNKSLKHLNLSGCDIGLEGANMLLQGMPKNITLETLKINRNNITDEGAIAIAEGLKLNQTLRVLELDNNKIKEPGGVALAKSLAMNKSLQVLSLKENSLKVESGKKLLEVSWVNKSLFSINLELNQVDVKIVKEIKNILTKNRELYYNERTERIKAENESLKIDENEAIEVNLKIQRTKEAKVLANRRLQKIRKIKKNTQINESAKLEALEGKYSHLKDIHGKLCAEENLLFEMQEKVKIRGDRKVKEMEYRINLVAREIETKESQSKIYLESILLEKFASKRAQMRSSIKKHQDTLENDLQAFEYAQKGLQNMQQRFDKKKSAVSGVSPTGNENSNKTNEKRKK